MLAFEHDKKKKKEKESVIYAMQKMNPIDADFLLVLAKFSHKPSIEVPR